MKISQLSKQQALSPLQLLIALLNKSPLDEVYTTHELAIKLGCNSKRLRDVLCDHKDELSKYSYKISNNTGRLWGNQQAIIALKRKLQTFNESDV